MRLQKINRKLGSASLCAGAGAFLILPLSVGAQESVQRPLTGAATATSGTSRLTDRLPLGVGPTAWRVSAGAGLFFQDNYNLSPTNHEADLTISPQVHTSMLWPITEKNSLTLGLGIGYNFSLQNSARDSLTLTPDSGLSFNIYVGDFLINLHDRVSISANAFQDPTIAGNGGYSQLVNTLGVATSWNLNQARLKLGYDHTIYEALQSGNIGTGSGQSEVVSFSSAYTPSPTTAIGLETGMSINKLNNRGSYSSPYSDSVQYNVGPFYEAQITEHITFQAHAGYNFVIPQSGGTNAVQSAPSYYYVQIGINHRLNQYISYSLSGGRSTSLAVSASQTPLYFINWATSWAVLRSTTLSTTLQFNQGSQGTWGSTARGETFEQYVAGISLGHKVTRKLTGSVGYQAALRNSDQADRDYVNNMFNLNLQWQLW